MRRRVALIVAFLAPALALFAGGAGTTVDEVAANLVCPCGCDNMIVSSCVCGTAAQIRAEIGEKLDAGMTAEQIWEEFARRYGRQILATPPAEGFHLTVWTLPFLAVFTAGWLLTRLLRRWSRRGATDAGEPAVPEPIAGDDELLRRMQEELRQFQQ